jgi:hypothetical protein
MFDALSFGNQVITVGAGGCYEYIKDYCIPVKYSKVPVTNMNGTSWYQHRHNWLEPDLKSAGDAMRLAYSERTRGRHIQSTSSFNYESERFSFDTVGLQLINCVNDTRDFQSKEDLQSVRRKLEAAV